MRVRSVGMGLILASAKGQLSDTSEMPVGIPCHQVSRTRFHPPDAVSFRYCVRVPMVYQSESVTSGRLGERLQFIGCRVFRCLCSESCA
jgi:hypothetical protein